MKKLIYLIPILCSILCFHSCDMLEAHPYDAKVRGEKNLNNKYIEQIKENLKDKKSFRFGTRC